MCNISCALAARGAPADRHSARRGVPRLIGLLYIIAFGGLAPQLLAVIGGRSIGPIAPRLHEARLPGRDLLYLRGFFVCAPSPTPLAWYAHHLPA